MGSATSSSSEPAPALSVETPGPSAALLANPVYAQGIGTLYTCKRNFYVNGVSGNDAAPGTIQAPWKTIQNADTPDRTGGDCINVAPGTYSTSGLQTQHGGTSASVAGYVVYRCQTLDGCHIQYNGTLGGHLWIFQGATYVVADGFEVDGNEQAAYGGLADSCFFSIQLNPYWRTSHHIWILNNKIHGCGLAGITFQSTEYVFAMHNEIYNNAWTSGYQGSGIALVVMQPLGAAIHGESFQANPFPTYNATAQDESFAPFHIMVSWNLVHDNGCTTCLGSSQVLSTTANTNSTSVMSELASTSGLAASQLVIGPGVQPMTYVASVSGTSVVLTRPATASNHGGTFQFSSITAGHTDGNGIILDTWVGGIGGNDNTYPNATLVLGNVSYSNGGRGIHVFATSNVTVANNSVFGNGLDLFDNSYYLADLSQAGGQNNTWINNVAQSGMTQANPSCGQYCGGRNSPFVAGDSRGVVDLNNTFIHNVTSGGAGIQLFANDVGYFSAAKNMNSATSLFTSPLSSNFTLLPTSSAVGYAQAESYVPLWITNAGAY